MSPCRWRNRRGFLPALLAQYLGAFALLLGVFALLLGVFALLLGAFALVTGPPSEGRSELDRSELASSESDRTHPMPSFASWAAGSLADGAQPAEEPPTGATPSELDSADAAPTSAEIDSALERVRRANIQWNIPENSEKPKRRSGNWNSPGFPFFQLLMYIVFGALVVLLVMLAASWFRNRAPPQIEDGRSPQTQVAVQLTSRPLELARAAAERGDFKEAIHLLLLGTIQEIRGSIGYEAPPWLTSREIVTLAPLPNAARLPLGKIVGAVQGSHFGTESVTKEDFLACAHWHSELRTECREGPSRVRR